MILSGDSLMFRSAMTGIVRNSQWISDPGFAFLRTRSSAVQHFANQADELVPAVAGIVLAPYTGGASLAVASAYYGYEAQKKTADAIAQNKPPGAPTIDTATQNMQEVDRLRRRRGALATIFGGSNSSSSPSVGVKTLLGQ